MPTTPSLDRTHLPAFAPRPAVETAETRNQQTAPFPPQPRLTAPEGAPNVLVILLDDMGFGASSAFGGPCRMPVAEELADNGLRFGRFHTTAICAPTRAALLTGRNHHSVGMGVLTEMATDAPGYDGMRGPDAATLAQTLNLNGYATGAFGKWHQTPVWEQTARGPFDRWPTNEGFERFYGGFFGETSQFTPTLIDQTNHVELPSQEEGDYHLSEDLVEKATDWITRVRAHDPEKPWFTYLAFGATHAPFHLPEELRRDNPYRGEFAHGYTEQREITLARQKELGLVPEDTELAPWQGDVPTWDALDDTQRTLAERLMETYAAFAEHTDAQIGKVVEFLRRTGELDNTLIFYILGDNGASAEAGFDGTTNEVRVFNGLFDPSADMIDQLDEIGGPTTYPHYNVGWAFAMDTPYQWAKQVASHYGGTRNGLVVHWPAGIRDRGAVRQQWHHVIDVAPTILEAAGIPHPESVNGVAQRPIEGTSFRYTFDDGDAPDRHTTQYFEMLGNRGIYHDGWTAVAQHRVPWKLFDPADSTFEDDVWELYDTTSDWSQARDVAAEHPEKLADLKELFAAEARRFQVFPLDDGAGARAFAQSGRPRRQVAVLTPKDKWVREQHLPNLRNGSFAVTAHVEVPAGGADGVVVAQGSRFGGWSLYLDAGRPVYHYNFLGTEHFSVTAERPLGEGPHEIVLEFAYDGAPGELGGGGVATLLVDGTKVGSGRVGRTAPRTFAVDETLNVGVDRGSPVTDAYGFDHANAFTGTVHTVALVAGDTTEPSIAEQLETALAYH
ncbi:arylsulfatase [Nocardioides thalensis]|uniref:Arylsulfatase n=1 Tax=Nocardioides thalensis TaxID=1914755 RepID=A0A853C6W1_9ACTN|nr:arylsulfatase [Nocardioides thalensis]NYJ02979.1 arylsulfatase [Nocardioides thalensis]